MIGARRPEGRPAVAVRYHAHTSKPGNLPRRASEKPSCGEVLLIFNDSPGFECIIHRKE